MTRKSRHHCRSPGAAPRSRALLPRTPGENQGVPAPSPSLAWLHGRRSSAKMGEMTAGPVATKEMPNQRADTDRQRACMDPSTQLADQSTQVPVPHGPCPTRMAHHVPGTVSTPVPCCHRLIEHPAWIKWGAGSHPCPVAGVTTLPTPKSSPRAARSCHVVRGVRLAGRRQETSANMAQQVVRTFKVQVEVLC